jgi:hypothetical protein
VVSVPEGRPLPSFVAAVTPGGPAAGWPGPAPVLRRRRRTGRGVARRLLRGEPGQAAAGGCNATAAGLLGSAVLGIKRCQSLTMAGAQPSCCRRASTTSSSTNEKTSTPIGYKSSTGDIGAATPVYPVSRHSNSAPDGNRTFGRFWAIEEDQTDEDEGRKR